MVLVEGGRLLYTAMALCLTLVSCYLFSLQGSLSAYLWLVFHPTAVNLQPFKNFYVIRIIKFIILSAQFSSVKHIQITAPQIPRIFHITMLKLCTY